MTQQQKTVLVAPLDWGLGHATRCIPVIEQLQEHGFKVIIGGSGTGLQLLKKRFPHLDLIELPSYRITYPTNGSMLLHMLLKTPFLLSAIQKEKKLLPSILRGYGISHVLSDNRYGLHHQDAHCVFMTHQVHIRSGTRFPFADRLLFWLQRRFLNQFNRVWIVDEPAESGGVLAGRLSSSEGLTIPHHYIGILSRFPIKSDAAITSEMHYDRLALLSGPEPQRTILEEKIFRHFNTLPGRSLIVKGVHGNTVTHINDVTFFDGITDSQMTGVLSHNPVFYARPGYSTLMDLARLQHGKVVFIPTPGQTEQEYLGKVYEEKYGFTCIQQASSFPAEDSVKTGLWPPLQDAEILKKIISQLC